MNEDRWVELFFKHGDQKLNWEQTQPKPDLLDYLRLWNIMESQDLLMRWVYHPNPVVKVQLENEFLQLKYRYDMLLDDVLEGLTSLHIYACNSERQGHDPFTTYEEAEEELGCLQREHEYRRYTYKN